MRIRPLQIESIPSERRGEQRSPDIKLKHPGKLIVLEAMEEIDGRQVIPDVWLELVHQWVQVVDVIAAQEQTGQHTLPKSKST